MRNPRVDDHGMASRPQDAGSLGHRGPPGDPGPGGSLSQEADIPVAKCVGAYVPEAAGPYPAGDRPDGGFHRVSGFQLLLERKQSFVVRRVADLKVYAGTHEGRLLRHWPLHPGQAVDLRQDKAVRVRVLGVWAPGQEEPWSARPPGRPGGPV